MLDLLFGERLRPHSIWQQDQAGLRRVLIIVLVEVVGAGLALSISGAARGHRAIGGRRCCMPTDRHG